MCMCVRACVCVYGPKYWIPYCKLLNFRVNTWIKVWVRLQQMNVSLCNGNKSVCVRWGGCYRSLGRRRE